MTPDALDPLGGGLVYEDALPLSWRPADPAVNAAHFNAGNESALRAMSALDEYLPEHVEDLPGQSHELARLEFKINLLMDLVGQLVMQNRALPPAVPLRIGARGIEWNCDPPPPHGSLVYLQVFLHPKYPRPFECLARVTGARNSEAGILAVAVFEGLSEAVDDWLEKLIFRHHRRSIAHARAPRAVE